jgi:hypothetical protein
MATSTIRTEIASTIVKDFLAAVIVHSEFCARLTAAAIEAFEEASPKGMCGKHLVAYLPKAFLMELSAVMRLRHWELGGIRDHIEAGLPSSQDATRELSARAAKGPEEFVGPQADLLSRRVFEFWISRFSWSGVETLGADLVVHGLDDDLLINTIADFLWSNRDALSSSSTDTSFI